MIRVLIVDDSAVVRQVLTELLSDAGDIEVVGVAADPLIARDKIKKLNPDVLTLDVEMPRMDGLTFLGNLMRLRPMPVIMVSSLTEKGADVTMQALEMGAVDYVVKPKIDVATELQRYQEELLEKIRVASKSRVRALERRLQVKPKYDAGAVLQAPQGKRHFKTTDQIIAIGASTGGTEAIKDIIIQMPAASPGIVITQHIPEAFSAAFAKRVDSLSAMTVVEATQGAQILNGHVYIAPGSHHLMVKRSGARYLCELSDGPPVNRHRPAVDVLFRSVAQNVGPNAVGVILTGMGDDGARGMKEMLDAGAYTIAQDEKTSVVWGMPKEAVRREAVVKVLPLEKISAALVSSFR